MDIYNYLKKDHRLVAELMEQVLKSKSPEKREELFNEIKKELKLHAETENATFYKALEDNPKSEEWIEEAEGEHDEIKEYLKKLTSTKTDSEKWIETFGEFKHAVSHHVEEEEGKIFEKAKQILSESQAEQIAEDMDALKQAKTKAA